MNPTTPTPKDLEAEQRLDQLMVQAFDTNHAAMHDYARLKMRLKRAEAAAFNRGVTGEWEQEQDTPNNNGILSKSEMADPLPGDPFKPFRLIGYGFNEANTERIVEAHNQTVRQGLQWKEELISICRIYCDVDATLPNEIQGGLQPGYTYAFLEGAFDRQEDRFAKWLEAKQKAVDMFLHKERGMAQAHLAVRLHQEFTEAVLSY